MDEDRIKGAATNIGGKVKDTFGDLTGDTKTQAEGKMDQAKGQLQNTAGSAKDAVREGASTVGAELDSFMSEKPMMALLIAAGVGYLVARVTSR
jgi:uncharacterized protein YjbJ (UPF0337 family)